MKVIAYTFEADLHCIDCTLKRHAAGRFTMADPLGLGSGKDENGVPYAATDREGNAVHPLFPTDEMSFNVCGDCMQEIEGVQVV